MNLVMSCVASAYQWAWKHTTREPWTYVMRRNPWLLPLFLIPYMVIGLFGMVLAGHVLWGRATRRLGEEDHA